MSWNLKRQIFFLTLFLLFIFAIGFLIIYPYFFSKEPTCFDNKKNGDEAGIDCGGSCALACIEEADDISILWSRSFEVISGRYNAVAVLENHNKDLAVRKISYKFRFADKDNIYIGKREGTTFIPPSGKFAIFEAGIGVGNSIPVYTTFEFMEKPVWEKVPAEKLNQFKILVSDVNLNNENTEPHLSAIIKNDSLFNMPDVGVVALLYDQTGNAVSASRTYLNVLGKSEIKEVNFTWPNPINAKIVEKEIIPIYDIFSAKLK